tara:strand:+ start:2070 stop:2414 length:345 start_codon:yes stop_codon:yes gene_type:complete
MSHLFPNVWISMGAHLGELSVFVEGEKRWRVSFESAVAVKICDESFDQNARFHVERDRQQLCSYTWADSSWLREFQTELAELLEGSPLCHYVFLGGNHNVEIMALGSVEIELAS